jgi:MYXO-CTERM domain-containing protein
MTLDPMFDFNADLGDYSNVHSATRVIECSSDVYQSEAPWRVQLSDGLVVRGRGFVWPFSPTVNLDQPANVRVVQDSTEGDGAVVTDNLTTIQQALATHNATIPPPEDTFAGDDGGACGCASTSSVPVEPVLVALAWLAAGLMRRRRQGPLGE